MYIVKRSGRRERFDPEKIKNALEFANQSVKEEDRVSKTIIKNIIERIESHAEEKGTMFTVEEVQNSI